MDFLSAPDPEAVTRRMGIFLVEDHFTTRRWLTRYLAGLGYQVKAAGTMKEAFEQWPGSECDLLLSDFQLPDGDGAELLEHLPLPRPARAIAMSGSAMPKDRARMAAAGYTHYVPKPFILEDLEKALDEAAAAIS